MSELLGDVATGDTDEQPATAAPELPGAPQAAADAVATTPEDDTTDAEDSEQPTGEEAATDEDSSGESDDDESLPAAAAQDDQDDAGEDDALEALAAAKGWPKSFLRRLQRERNKGRKTAGELEALRQKVQALEEGREAGGRDAVAGTADAPVTDEETRLAQQAHTLSTALRTLARNRDGMTITENGQSRELSADEVEEYREQYRRQLARVDVKLEHLAAARAQRAQALEAETLRQHPWMADPNHQNRRIVDGVLRQYPALKAVPEMPLILANNLAYLRALKANGGNANGNGSNGNPDGTYKGANGNGHHAPPPPRTAPRSTARPGAAPSPAPSGDRAALGAHQKRFNETGDLDAGKALVSALLD